MQLSDAFWQVFTTTGHVGAYLLYRTYVAGEDPMVSESQDRELRPFAMGTS